MLALDHLVLAARTLEEGLDWCEATLGLRPDMGGRHDSMGTHNRVFAIGSAAFPRAYFEIIAIDPVAPAPAHRRWFDLDDPALQCALAARGPQLVHWVARCASAKDAANSAVHGAVNGAVNGALNGAVNGAANDTIDAASAAMRAAGIDCGEILRAERATPRGILRWRISVRADGRRPLGGAAPALIEWGDTHPTDAMPPSSVALQSMQVAAWPTRLTAMLPAGIDPDPQPDAPPIRAVLTCPRGTVTLESLHLKG